mmetsp:Transcript_12500/g.29341  ORF Transcript_12500/g.29341 Transcript_12500/m.29341 type:complete len:393 (+) Transcript_12500:28-1206(+)
MSSSRLRGGGAGRLPLAVACAQADSSLLELEELRVRAHVREFEGLLRARWASLLEHRGSAPEAGLLPPPERVQQNAGACGVNRRGPLPTANGVVRVATESWGPASVAQPEAAIVRIQSWYRGSLARRLSSCRREAVWLAKEELRVKDAAATRLQSVCRGSLVRRREAAAGQARQQQSLEMLKRNAAAHRIQASFRGMRARRELGVLRRGSSLQEPLRVLRSEQAGIGVPPTREASYRTGGSKSSWGQRRALLSPDRRALTSTELPLLMHEAWSELLMLRQRKASRLSEVDRLEQLVELGSDGRCCSLCDMRLVGLRGLLQALGRICREVASACGLSLSCGPPTNSCEGILAALARALQDCASSLPAKASPKLEVLGQEIEEFVAYLVAVGHS